MSDQARPLPTVGTRPPSHGARRALTPLQAELLEAGLVPDPDALGSSLARHDIAIDAGYGDTGPTSLPGPEPAAPPGDDDHWPPRAVRRSHGVNCSGSCSWEVFVKDGLICWELQKTGSPLYVSQCARCHGIDGAGQGLGAASPTFGAPPRDLTRGAYCDGPLAAQLT